ncbi:MAG TPA: PHP domain-containing protein [Candidatus Saccharimonadales bacterium]|nr:PHP domain-containing protein [Candidatus Saccharimonadales bacterium]
MDLHTHSVASPDGSLSLQHYTQMLATKRLDYIAITDHNTITFALEVRKALGNVIIVGEEITTTEGDIIGLFLHEPIPAGLALAEAITRIKAQHGLVYVPHPFETVRKGVRATALDSVVGQIDIVEVRNGRAVFQNYSQAASNWAASHSLPGAASSDSHGWHGWGKTYSLIDRPPTADTLPASLQAARLIRRAPGPLGLLYPKYNRLRKVFTHGA